MACLAVVMFLLTTICFAETNWNLQAVDGDGVSTYPLINSQSKITIEGIILNKPGYMVNHPEGEWQIFIQGEDGDHAGTAVYMRKNNFGPTYTEQEWADELYRISNDPCGNYEFQPGDRVRVTGLTWFYGGKANINEQHSLDPANDFTIDLIDPAPGLPEPEVITLNMVKDGNNNFIFDHTRMQGCEYYQGTLVRVNDVNISGGVWEPNQTVIIKDSAGLTFNVKLGWGDGFAGYPMPTGQIDVIGIFNQEDPTFPYTGGYEIGVVNYDGNGSVLTDNCGLNGYFAGDINKDCMINFEDFAILAADWLKCSNPSYDECTIP